MTKDKRLGDAEEIRVDSSVGEEEGVNQETAVSREEAGLLDEIRKIRAEQVEQQKEIVRLRAIADDTRGRIYDQATRDKSWKGHLRYVEDAADPVVFWKTLRNISTVDPVSGQLIADQKMLLRTLSGKEYPMVDIHEWNNWRSNQVKIKFLKIDHALGRCDVQLSTDGGASFTGEVIKDLPITFVNP